MVSLIFKGCDSVLSEQSAFQRCIASCKKVDKLTIDNVDITLEYVNLLHSNLMNQEKFTSRVKHLQLKNLKFTEGSNELQKDFMIGKFCQVLC